MSYFMPYFMSYPRYEVGHGVEHAVGHVVGHEECHTYAISYGLLSGGACQHETRPSWLAQLKPKTARPSQAALHKGAVVTG